MSLVYNNLITIYIDSNHPPSPPPFHTHTQEDNERRVALEIRGNSSDNYQSTMLHTSEYMST